MKETYLIDKPSLRKVGRVSFIDSSFEEIIEPEMGFDHLYVPLSSQKDNIFREIINDIPSNYSQRITAFISSLSEAYLKRRDPNVQYIPIRIAENDENGVVYEWVFENVRFMFVFNSDEKDSCSIVSFDPVTERLTSSIIPLDPNKYDQISSEIMSHIS